MYSPKPLHAQVGSATGQIGDPSGKSADRNLIDHQTLAHNTLGVRKCITDVMSGIEARARELEAAGEGLSLPAPNSHLDSHGSAVRVVENAQFYTKMSPLEFLRDVGRHFRLGQMLARDSVRSRLESDAGMSYTEFSYQLLQAWDFLQLREQYGCVLQAGGSDQWGNITAGVDLVRRAEGDTVFGVTVPLLTTSTGAKLGKTEGNAVWLTAPEGPAFALYQYCLRLADDDAVALLPRLTMLSDTACQELTAEHSSSPEKRRLQRRLAEEVVLVTRGAKGLSTAEAVTDILFSKTIKPEQASLEVCDELRAAAIAEEVPTAWVSSLVGADVREAAVAAGVAKSKAEVGRMIKARALHAGPRRVESLEDARIRPEDLIGDGVAVLRAGRAKPFLVLQRTDE